MSNLYIINKLAIDSSIKTDSQICIKLMDSMHNFPLCQQTSVQYQDYIHQDGEIAQIFPFSLLTSQLIQCCQILFKLRMKPILFLTLLSLLHNHVQSAATFQISSVSTCTQQSPSGFCTRWQQNGSVTQTTSCFPSTTQLYVLQDGQQVMKAMKDLKIGDLVLGLQGEQQIYTEVIGWLHKSPQKYGQYLQVRTTQGSFMSSAFHNIAVLGSQFQFARDLTGKQLSSGEVVESIKNVTAKGIYAPMTKSFNYFVSGGQKQRVLAHCFANIKNPQYYQTIVSSIWSLWQNVIGVQQGYQIHPAAGWMKNKFSFLIQQ